MTQRGADLPNNFRRIKLELAREPGHPEGASAIGYDFVAPLDAEARLDAAAWRDHKEACRVLRSHEGVTSVGRLRRRPGGSWAFHYELDDAREDDDAGYRLGEHRFAPGEYVTIQEDDGPHTYRVVSVQPA